MLTIIRISLFLIFSITTAKAQYLTLQIGGANGVVPNLSYEQVVFGRSSNKGIRLSAGGGFKRDVYTFSAGVSAFLEGKSIFEIGFEMGRMVYSKMEGSPTYDRYFPYVGIRFGEGVVRGFTALGPLWIYDHLAAYPRPNTSGVTVTSAGGPYSSSFAVKGGISVRIFPPRGSRKGGQE